MKNIFNSLHKIHFDNNTTLINLKHTEDAVRKFVKRIRIGNRVSIIIASILILSGIFYIIELNTIIHRQHKLIKEYQHTFGVSDSNKTYFVIENQQLDTLVSLSWSSISFWFKYYQLPENLAFGCLLYTSPSPRD